MQIIEDRVPNPPYLMWPTIASLRSLGSSGTLKEIDDAIAVMIEIDEEAASYARAHDPGPLFNYRTAWARSYLKRMGLVENSTRGVWSLTEAGREVNEVELPELLRLANKQANEESQRRRAEREELGDDESADDDESDDWKASLLGTLKSMAPDAFERVAQRLLREAGFINTQVLGKSGDGGIDGVGTFRMALVSFPIYFQCKRYKGSVGSSEVRDFRGAMSGRGEKGLLITTGSFTAEAMKESVRDGAPPIDLVDGDRLCDLLKEYRVGVKVEVVEVEKIEINTKFFDDV